MTEYIFRMPDGREVGRASNLKEFLKELKRVPIESLSYHYYGGHFYAWLKDKGYGGLVPRLKHLKIESDAELREKLVKVVSDFITSHKPKKHKKKTKISKKTKK